jgi:hypothetical protein
MNFYEMYVGALWFMLIVPWLLVGLVWIICGWIVENI